VRPKVKLITAQRMELDKGINDEEITAEKMVGEFKC
jgi:hypothetical protein